MAKRTAVNLNVPAFEAALTRSNINSSTLAKLSDINPSTITRCFDTGRVSLETAVAMAKVLRVPIGEIVFAPVAATVSQGVEQDPDATMKGVENFIAGHAVSMKITRREAALLRGLRFRHEPHWVLDDSFWTRALGYWRNELKIGDEWLAEVEVKTP